MHKENGVFTRGQIYLDFHRVYMAQATNADQLVFWSPGELARRGAQPRADRAEPEVRDLVTRSGDFASRLRRVSGIREGMAN